VLRLIDENSVDLKRFTDVNLARLLTDPIVLPSPPFPLLQPAALAGPPVIADLYVVRDEWARHVAGEPAFIENVMPGEDRERSTHTKNLSQTIVEGETIDVSKTRDETYSSERTTESEETTKQTSLEVGLQFNNDLTIKYGPVENNTQIGASLAFSRSDSERRAKEIARESGRRAIVETEKRVRRLRRETTQTVVRELDAHRLKNSCDDAVRGVYRWVEKVQRYQIFKLPHRLQLEFYIPEPGKLLRQILDGRRSSSGPLPVPGPFYLTVSGDANPPLLLVEDILPDNYLFYGNRLGVFDIPTPPAAVKIISESVVINAGTRDKEKNTWDLLPFPPTASATKDMQIPDGYEAVSWKASASAAPELAKWRDHNDGSKDDGVNEQIGYHSIVVSITIGSTNVLLDNRASYDLSPPLPPLVDSNTVMPAVAGYREYWLSDNAEWRDQAGNPTSTLKFVNSITNAPEPLTGKVSFGATLGGAYNGSVSVALECAVTDAAMAAWRSSVYELLASAVQARSLQIENAKRANLDQSVDDVQRAISPSVRKQLILNEYKRQVLECLLAERFVGFHDAPDLIDSNQIVRPNQDFASALRHSGLVRFFEQSFEWDNMMSVQYPGYWAGSENWKRSVAFDSTDLELQAFLQSGGARVLVPARPGFESAVFTFLETGLILGTDQILGGSGTSSLSIADEIMSITRKKDDGEPGDSWESVVPTAMLWLDTELVLPIVNPDPQLPKARR
jgi:hypothetical protein